MSDPISDNPHDPNYEGEGFDSSFPALDSVYVPITLDEIGIRLSALEESNRVNSLKIDEQYKGIQWLCNIVSQGMATMQNSPMAQTMLKKFVGGGKNG